MKQMENEMIVSVPLEVVKASEIEPREVKWLWYPYRRPDVRALAQEQYLDIEHEEFHSLAKWDDFIADPGRYLNGMIEGEFEE